MSERPSNHISIVLVMLLFAVCGCGRQGPLPTALAPSDGLTTPASGLEARNGRILATTPADAHKQPPTALTAEVREALKGVFTGEQVYFQRNSTFIDVPSNADFVVTLGVNLGDLVRRWNFSVSGASQAGFVASARGRDDSEAAGITVTLTHHRGQPIVWAYRVEAFIDDVDRDGPQRSAVRHEPPHRSGSSAHGASPHRR